MKKIRFFNMIEVLLALGITAIGITGLMGIIPLGLNANRDALAETFTADIANTYFAQLNRMNATASSFTSFTDTMIPFGDPVSKSTVSADGKSYDVYANPTEPKPEDWKNGEGKIEYLHKFDGNGIDFDTSKLDTLHYMRVFVGRKDGTNAVMPDFVADLCGWWCYPDDIPDVDNSGAGGNPRLLVRVYLEVSWPVSATYPNRQKRVFVREFYNIQAATEE